MGPLKEGGVSHFLIDNYKEPNNRPPEECEASPSLFDTLPLNNHIIPLAKRVTKPASTYSFPLNHHIEPFKVGVVTSPLISLFANHLFLENNHMQHLEYGENPPSNANIFLLKHYIEPLYKWMVSLSPIDPFLVNHNKGPIYARNSSSSLIDPF